MAYKIKLNSKNTTFKLTQLARKFVLNQVGRRGLPGQQGEDGVPGVVQAIIAGTNVTVDDTDPANPIVSSTGGGGGGAVDSVNSQTGVVLLDQDDIPDGTTAKQYTAAEKTKLAGIEPGAEENNISDADAADLTDGNTTTLHNHDNRYYTETETDTLLSDKQPLDADLTALAAAGNSAVLAATTASFLTADEAKLDFISVTQAVDLDTMESDISGKQPLDSDLTAIAALTPTNDDIIQRKSGAWTNRTPAQVKTDLALTKTDVGLSAVTNDAQLKIASNLADVASPSTAFSNIKQAASDTATGAVELATLAEVNTGTDTTRVVTPDTLSGSYAGTKPVSVYVVEAATLLSTGDGKAYFRIPIALNGMDLVSVGASVMTTSSSGTPTVQIARGRQANATTAHAYVDMLSTLITIDATEYDSKDATTAAVINASNDDVLTGDLIRIDVDVAGTGTKGLNVTLAFRLL